MEALKKWALSLASSLSVIAIGAAFTMWVRQQSLREWQMDIEQGRRVLPGIARQDEVNNLRMDHERDQAWDDDRLRQLRVEVEQLKLYHQVRP